MFHSYAFDFSVWEIWGALTHGGLLVIVPFLVSRSPELFYQLVKKENVTVLNQTPSAFFQFIHAEEILSAERKLNLRLVIFGGEVLDFSILKRWLERHGDTNPKLFNMYGIT
jgi:non-ribosomal peptide synthetase component F